MSEARGRRNHASTVVRGWYRDPDTGERVEDESWRFILAVPAGELPHLRAFLSAVATEFRQKAIYLSAAGEVEFVRGGS